MSRFTRIEGDVPTVVRHASKGGKVSTVDVYDADGDLRVKITPADGQEYQVLIYNYGNISDVSSTIVGGGGGGAGKFGLRSPGAGGGSHV